MSLFGFGRRRPSEAWVVMLGESEETLSPVAVTGTHSEALDLLEKAAETFPALTNEFSNCPLHSDGRVERSSRVCIAQGERRPVYVVEEIRPSDDEFIRFDVFQSGDQAKEYANALESVCQVRQVITNEWFGVMQGH